MAVSVLVPEPVGTIEKELLPCDFDCTKLVRLDAAAAERLAQRMHQETQDGRTRLLGAEHSETRASVHNLAALAHER